MEPGTGTATELLVVIVGITEVRREGLLFDLTLSNTLWVCRILSFIDEVRHVGAGKGNVVAKSAVRRLCEIVLKDIMCLLGYVCVYVCVVKCSWHLVINTPARPDLLQI